MRKKKQLILASIFIIVLALYIIIFLMPAKKVETKFSDAVSDEKQGDVSDSPKKDISSGSESDKEMKRPENISPEVWEKYLRIYEREKANNVPIEFYGKIIDQDGTPVPNVKISLRVFSKLERYKREIELFSDYDGLFSLSGVTGTSLHIEKLEKEGYIERNRTGTFDYAKYKPIHNPNINNPLIIRIWRKGETEPLIREETKIKIIGDNSKFYTDLISGTTSQELTDNADLIIQMKIDKPDTKGLYNWSISIGAVNGGLIDNDDEFLYQAPESGYRQNMDMFFDKTYRWSDDAYKKIYLKSRNGQVYAKLKVSILAYQSGKGLIRISSTINPNGSGNLEYDPAKRIRVRR